MDTAGIQYGQDGWLYMCGGQLACEQGNLGTVGASCLSTGTQQQLMRSEHTNTWIEREREKNIITSENTMKQRKNGRN